MSDWVNLIRRYRKLHGLTQAAFSELIGVEQATVSRWERGWHVPELEIQRRLRDLIWKKSAGSDALLFHRVRGSLSPTKLANKSGKNFAASRLAARLHGVDPGTLCKIDLYEEPDVKDANGEPVVTRVLTIMLAEEY